MKTTTATQADTSRTGAVLWFAVLVLVAGFMFSVGRLTTTTSPAASAALMDAELELQRLQGAVDRLRTQNRSEINAMALRVAELQAASIRLDALGERLARTGQLNEGEFDFDQPVPMGGAELSDTGPASDSELRNSLSNLSERMRRQSVRLEALEHLMLNRQVESEFTPSGWPVSKGWISSRYGSRTDPFTGEPAHHRGVDFAGVRGTEVLSVAGGVVIWAGARAAYGKTVEIDHGNGFRTRYAHCDSIEVASGERVTAGQMIARMGSTGRASAPHVHFEVLQNGDPVNPARFVGQLR